MGARVSRLLGCDLLNQGGLMLPTISGTPNLPRTPSWKSSWPLGAPGKVDFSIAFFLQAFHLLAPLYPSRSTYNPTRSARGQSPYPGGRVGLIAPCLILVPPPQRGPVGLKDGGKHLPSHVHHTELSYLYTAEGQASFL